jgi:hypothetical protein
MMASRFMIDQKSLAEMDFSASYDFLLIQVLIWENTRYLSNFAPAWKGMGKTQTSLNI